jgi:hypothetical protein
MKLLVFGNSDSKGGLVVGAPWPEQMRARLEAETGVPVELRHRGLSPLGEDAAGRAERMVAEAQPDHVVLPLSNFAFAIGFVEPRIERLLGKRAAEAYLRAEHAFEAKTGTTATRRSRINRMARKTLRRAVGTEPHASVEQVANVYIDILHRLSRAEHLQVVALTYPAFGKALLKKNRKAETKNERFERLVRAVVEEHRFLWVDGQAAVRQAGLGDAVLAEDGSHLSAVGHALYGQVLASVISREVLVDA